MTWPAVYVFSKIQDFWFLIFVAIVIESILLRVITKFDWKKSILVSSIGNIIANFVGSYLMIWVMLLWHCIVDTTVFHKTFNPINWGVTFICMCFGTALIEAFITKVLFKKKIKKTYLPLAFGNMICYLIIAMNIKFI